jgi:hypothetical protein
MKINPRARWTLLLLLGFGSLLAAQEPAPAPAAVEGIKGVKEDAVEKIKHVETGNAAADNGGVTTGSANAAQGVNKINGVETINGVKADGRTVVPPTQPVVPPPVQQGGTAVAAGGGSVGSGGTIHAVKGVAGLNTTKIQNLEAALILKQGGGGTPAGAGAEKGGKGKSAAAALLAAPLEKAKAPKEDGRAGFQEFEKLQNNGS